MLHSKHKIIKRKGGSKEKNVYYDDWNDKKDRIKN